MTNIDIAKTILKYVGRDSIEVDRALAEGCIILLSKADEVTITNSIGPGCIAPEEAAKALTKQNKHDSKIVPKQEKTEQKQAKKPGPKKSTFDVGKLSALWKAGWSIPKIADEMGVSEPTVRKYLKQIGAKETVKNEQTASV